MSDPVARLNAALEGRYRIERELGEGGMATVYLADDLKHERKVELKVLKPELAAVVGAERFLAEIKTTANLTHPHILPLHDSGEADGFLFYVMPHIEGESLRERIDREKQLGVDDAVAITQKVANALDYAHGHGVVHRDIKPGNILLSAQGEPLVADFGIALAVAQAGAGRITETGLSLGTPHYMSPEQATGDRDVDLRLVRVPGQPSRARDTQVVGARSHIQRLCILLRSRPTRDERMSMHNALTACLCMTYEQTAPAYNGCYVKWYPHPGFNRLPPRSRYSTGALGRGHPHCLRSGAWGKKSGLF